MDKNYLFWKFFNCCWLLLFLCIKEKNTRPLLMMLTPTFSDFGNLSWLLETQPEAQKLEGQLNRI